MSKDMGKLDKAVIYLSGSIEFAADHGIGWRRQFIELTKKCGLQVDCIDPTNKPGDEQIHIGENQEHQIKLQKNGQYQELKDYVHQFRHFDLRFTDYSDCLVVVVDSVPQWGTANEIYVAEAAHKPIFLICEGGLARLPRWLFDVTDLDKVFESIEDVVNYLVKLDNGEIALDDKWILIRKHIEQYRQ
jgi:hypothetical protein